MEYRTLGKTNFQVSALGFGCGAVGGMMVQGEPHTQTRAVARALEAGVTYFDTAQMYGNGQSETNLGRVLKELNQEVGPGNDVFVGSKVRLDAAGMEDIPRTIVQAAEVSLQRLQLDVLDLYQLHNSIAMTRQAQQGAIGIDDLEAVRDAFQRLQQAGKIRHWGINGLGETEALHHAVTHSGADTIQACYNLLNPSGGWSVPANFPFQDYKHLIDQANEKNIGVIAIRILAAGALSGEESRHPIAAQSVAPIASGQSYAADVAHAQRFRFLIKEGWVDTLVEGAIRFALSQPGIATALIGLSTLEHLEQAIAAAERGPLLPEALDRLARG